MMGITPKKYGISWFGSNSLSPNCNISNHVKSCKMRPRPEILPSSQENQPVNTRVANPHHFNAHSDPPLYFNADPDQTFHLNVDPDPDFAPYQSDVNLRTLVYRPSRAPL
jgi:hypothetical protein